MGRTRRIERTELFAILALTGALAACHPPAASSTEGTQNGIPPHTRAAAIRHDTPLTFAVANASLARSARFVSLPPALPMAFDSDGAQITLDTRAADDSRPAPSRSVRLRLVGARNGIRGEGVGEQPGRVNYLLGNDRRAWRTNLASFARVRYRDVYPRVDVEYYGTRDHLEYDLVVARGGRPADIALYFDHADRVTLDADGALIVHAGASRLRQERPRAYQLVGDTQRHIDCRYAIDRDTVRFELGPYDRALALTIDPVVVYTTSLRGARITGMTTDAAGNVYLTGPDALPADFPGVSTKLPSRLPDVFIAKFDARNDRLVYATYLGGNRARGYTHSSIWVSPHSPANIVLDAAGNVCITGYTASTDFPAVNAYQPTPSQFYGPSSDAFVAKLDPNGSTLVFSTYLGGPGGWTEGRAVAVDVAGNVYVAGLTAASDFPASSRIGTAKSMFVAKFTPGGGLVYATRVGGSAVENPVAIAADATGAAHVVGVTYSPDFPLERPLVAVCPPIPGRGFEPPRPCGAAFLMKLDASGSRLVYSTYLAGSSDEALPITNASAVGIDSAGNAYTAGETPSPTFLPMNPGERTHAGGTDAFVVSTTPAGDLRYVTYLGGPGNESSPLIDVNPDGTVLIAGSTTSNYFPAVKAAFDIGGPLFATSQNGAPWRAAGRGLASPVNALLVDPDTGALFAATDLGVFRRVHGVWTPAGDVEPRLGKTTALASDARGGLYAQTERGMFRSTDGAATWTMASTTLASMTCLAVNPVDPQSMFATNRGTTVWRSRDGGSTWTMTYPLIGGVSAAVWSPDGAWLYAAAYGVYRSSDGGATWTRDESLAGQYVHDIERDPAAPGALYAAATGGVFRSSDGARTWQRLGQLTDARALAVAGETSVVLYAATSSEPNVAAVHRSTDGGASWQPVNEGLPGAVSLLAATSEAHPLVWASTESSSSAPFLAQIPEGGGTFRFLTNLPAPGHGVTALAEEGGRVFVSLRDLNTTSSMVMQISLDISKRPATAVAR
jgi:hypothetical protein